MFNACRRRVIIRYTGKVYKGLKRVLKKVYAGSLYFMTLSLKENPCNPNLVPFPFQAPDALTF